MLFDFFVLAWLAAKLILCCIESSQIFVAASRWMYAYAAYVQAMIAK